MVLVKEELILFDRSKIQFSDAHDLGTYIWIAGKCLNNITGSFFRFGTTEFRGVTFPATYNFFRDINKLSSLEKKVLRYIEIIRDRLV